LLGVSAQAQVAPQIDPGVIQNDIERQQRQIEQQSQTPKLRGPAVAPTSRKKPQTTRWMALDVEMPY
jgi:hypothetical protein